MKEDAPTPKQVPKKRRQLEQALDRWLVEWLARNNLTPSERRRVEEEQRTRKSRQQPIIIGFTGTRAGMTPDQRTWMRGFVINAVNQGVTVEAHHGDCVGADEQFHSLCRAAGVPVILHPPKNAKLRAHCQGATRSEKAKEYQDRNKDMVHAATVLVAAPKEHQEPAPARGQGTWATVRYARQRGLVHHVVLPNGEVLGG